MDVEERVIQVSDKDRCSGTCCYRLFDTSGEDFYLTENVSEFVWESVQEGMLVKLTKTEGGFYAVRVLGNETQENK